MIRVAAAVLVRGGKVLAARRAPGKRLGGLWEFPGGKLEPGEDPSAALVRELKEELGLDAVAGPELMRSVHDYDFGRVELIGILCRAPAAGPLSSTDHDRLEWAEPSALSSYSLTPADVPLAARLARGDWADLLGA